MVLYAVHDSTIASLNAVLDTKLDHWPPYASTFVLERFRSAANATFFRAIQDGSEVDFSWCLPKQDGLCAHDKFLAYASARIPTSHALECRIP